MQFCGDTIAGISLLSSAVMRLVNEKEKESHADLLLRRRSLYILRQVYHVDCHHKKILSPRDQRPSQEIRHVEPILV